MIRRARQGYRSHKWSQPQWIGSTSPSTDSHRRPVSPMYSAVRAASMHGLAHLHRRERTAFLPCVLASGSGGEFTVSALFSWLSTNGTIGALASSACSCAGSDRRHDRCTVGSSGKLRVNVASGRTRCRAAEANISPPAQVLRSRLRFLSAVARHAAARLRASPVQIFNPPRDHSPAARPQPIPKAAEGRQLPHLRPDQIRCRGLRTQYNSLVSGATTSRRHTRRRLSAAQRHLGHLPTCLEQRLNCTPERGCPQPPETRPRSAHRARAIGPLFPSAVANRPVVLIPTSAPRKSVTDLRISLLLPEQSRCVMR